MASAWGKSWGLAFGAAWGLVVSPPVDTSASGGIGVATDSIVLRVSAHAGNITTIEKAQPAAQPAVQIDPPTLNPSEAIEQSVGASFGGANVAHPVVRDAISRAVSADAPLAGITQAIAPALLTAPFALPSNSQIDAIDADFEQVLQDPSVDVSNDSEAWKSAARQRDESIALLMILAEIA